MAGLSPAASYLIWSNEHCAWWRPGRWGYTPDIAGAGRYAREEALQIARRALDGRPARGNPNEIAIPEQDALDQFSGLGAGMPAVPPQQAQRFISFVNGNNAPSGVDLIVAVRMRCCHPGAKMISTGQRMPNGGWVLPHNHDVEIVGWMVAPAFPEILAPEGGEQ